MTISQNCNNDYLPHYKSIYAKDTGERKYASIAINLVLLLFTYVAIH